MTPNLRTIIARHRDKCGWSNAHLAHAAGLNRQTVNAWLSGKQASIHTAHLERLLQVLCLSITPAVRDNLSTPAEAPDKEIPEEVLGES